MRKFIPFLLISLILYGRPASQVNLREILEETRKNNPEIQASRAKYEAMLSRTSPFINLMDPVVSTEVSSNDIKMYSISQNIPFPTKLFSKSNFQRAEAEVYKNVFFQKEQEILNMVKRSYAQLFFLHKKYSTINESRSFYNQLFRISSQNYSIGKASQSDMLKAQVELSKTENDLLKIKDDISIEETRLNMLLNREFDSPIGIPQEINLSPTYITLDSLFELARKNTPNLKTAFWVRERAKRMKSLANQSYLPDFSLKFSQEEMPGGMTNQKYMVGLSIPIYFWGKQNEKVKEAQASIKLAEAHYKSEENKILLEVKEAKTNVDNYNRTKSLYKKTIIPQAKASLNSALSAYEANRIDFLSLLDSERALISFELEYYKAIIDLYKAIADLEESVGVNLTNEKEE
jgi:cobalt-zinc-cadmium efflux system outer membrane protein